MAKWAELPKAYQEVVTVAAAQVAADLMAKYDTRNAPAIKRLVAAGAQPRPFSVEIMDAAYNATIELFTEVADKNPTFKKLYDSMSAFRNEQYAWHQDCEANYDNYEIRTRSGPDRGTTAPRHNPQARPPGGTSPRCKARAPRHGFLPARPAQLKGSSRGGICAPIDFMHSQAHFLVSANFAPSCCPTATIN